MIKNNLLVSVTVFALTLPHCTSVIAHETGQTSNNLQCSAPVYSGKAMDRKAKILAKPDPNYDKSDRRKHADQVIVLTAILCGSGEVTDINVKSGPSDTAEAKAVEAARKIRFIPGEKDDQKVSTFVTLLYRVKH